MKETKVSSSLTIENYVQNTYINLLGRKATKEELKPAVENLRQDQFSTRSRRVFLEPLLVSNEYKDNLYLMARNDLLNFIFNPDSMEIEQTIKVWKQAEQNERGRKELVRLKSLQRVRSDLCQNRLSNRTLQARLIYNSYYDFINMGTENFVVSMYHNLLDRPPTVHELEEGKKMVDGTPAYFEFKEGKSKDDFVNLFFESYSYYEAQIKKAFQRILFRLPTPEESVQYTTLYRKTKSYETVLEELLVLDEYANR